MRLFKYFGIERLSVFATRLIRFSQPAIFNDPFEFSPYIESISSLEEVDAALNDASKKDFSELYYSFDSEARKNITKEDFQLAMSAILRGSGAHGKTMMDQLLPTVQPLLYQGWNENIGVMCLSEKNDDLLMWAHYADCHKGFVLEFDPQSEFFDKRIGPKDSLRSLRKVTYSQKRPAITLSQANEEAFFLTKSDHWEYEAEWRMMIPLADADHTKESEEGAICLFEFPMDAIKSVIFGAKMSEGAVKSIIDQVSVMEGYKHLEFLQAKIHPTDYSLIIEKAVSY